MKDIKIYTDGACSGNPGPGGYGVILMYEDFKKEISGYDKETTNNKMEITAVLKGLELLKYPCNVEIYSDSAYVVNAIEKGWLFNWKKNNWKKKGGEVVKNIELWEQMLKYMDNHKIKFIKVKGHSDNIYNNRCDELAVNAIKDNNLI